MMERESRAAAIAHPNIALAKYWGKRGADTRDGWVAAPGNYPAVPSLSVTLDAFATRTEVAFEPALRADRLVLNHVEESGAALARVRTLLDRVRDASGRKSFAVVKSENDFPTASGLASSASGFAALALASVRAAGLPWDAAQTSDLARRSSASAARSLFGGFVELDSGPAGPHGESLAARPVAGRNHVDWRLLVAVATEEKKAVGSTDGMTRSVASPYYGAWLDLAPRLFVEMRQALLARDLERTGALVERSALAMHACAAAAGIFYFGTPTLEALSSVRALRAKGVLAFATMDAGPHVKVLTSGEDAALVGTWLRAVPGILRVVEARAGEDARLLGADVVGHASASQSPAGGPS